MQANQHHFREPADLSVLVVEVKDLDGAVDAGLALGVRARHWKVLRPLKALGIRVEVLVDCARSARAETPRQIPLWRSAEVYQRTERRTPGLGVVRRVSAGDCVG